MSDKLVALDPDKAQLCYLICRALDAHRVIEAGTSFGVSTLYLAAALRDSARSGGGRRLVIGTEYEPAKANAARANVAAAALDQYIELREGDLRDTLRNLDGPVDFMLIDVAFALRRRCRGRRPQTKDLLDVLFLAAFTLGPTRAPSEFLGNLPNFRDEQYSN